MNVFDVLASTAVLGAVVGGLSGLSVHGSHPRPPGRDVLVLVLGLVSATSTIAIVHAPAVLRVPIAAAAVLLAPGFSIIGFRRLDDLLDELAIALGLSFALLVVLGTLMVGVGLWNPVGLAALLGIVTAPVLTRQGVVGLRSRAVSGADRADG